MIPAPRLIVKLILAILVIPGSACTAVPAGVDTILDTTPEPAAGGGYLVAALELSLPVWIHDEAVFELGLYGYSRLWEDHYEIALDPRLEPAAKMMVLLHELAHVLVWDRGWEDPSPHGAEWGWAYAEVFRLWVREES